MKTGGEKGKSAASLGDFRSELATAMGEFGLSPLNDRESSLLTNHFRLISDWNQRANLTRITNAGEAARFHYAESVFGAQFIERSAALLDVGSGAGFPAVPLAVVRSDVNVTALEPNLKKSVFLKEVKDALALKNFQVVRARLEEFDWSAFQVVTTRAVERASELVPSIVRRLVESQSLVLFCGESLRKELASAFEGEISLAVHPIPRSNDRLVVVISRKGV